VAPRGDTPIEHLISHVLLGDLVSLYLAVLRGKDPIDIAPIDALKAALADR
jgi:glucose/mannose-6-phosphate isomerase